MSKFEKAYKDIKSYLVGNNDSGDRFSSYLRKNKIPHLSYTSISSIDSCPYRYYLTYIKCVELDPTPLYFIKGKVFHEYAAAKYKICMEEGFTSTYNSRLYLPGTLDEDHKTHIKNATTVLNKNIWENWEIIGIERPFVFSISDDIPPIVGVIDLLLEKDGMISVVDHKTGRDFFKTNFYDPSKIQMSIYYKYVSEEFRSSNISLYYDKYRWINNLDRIRKPAFEREKINITKNTWRTTENLLKSSYQMINNYADRGTYPKNGECFRCPYKELCD